MGNHCRGGLSSRGELAYRVLVLTNQGIQCATMIFDEMTLAALTMRWQ